MRRTIFEPEHDHFRESVGAFLRSAAAPHADAWERAGLVPREFWQEAAAQGMVGFELPERFGGLDIADFRFNAVIDEEVAYTGSVGDGFTMQNDIIVPYLLELTDEQQKHRWLPPFARGDLIAALAMTEPGAGSDLQGMQMSAKRDGDSYLINGTKTFVTSGIMADLVIVAARTSPAGESTASRCWRSSAIPRGLSAGASSRSPDGGRRTRRSCSLTMFACRSRTASAKRVTGSRT